MAVYTTIRLAIERGQVEPMVRDTLERMSQQLSKSVKLGVVAASQLVWQVGFLSALAATSVTQRREEILFKPSLYGAITPFGEEIVLDREDGRSQLTNQHFVEIVRMASRNIAATAGVIGIEGCCCFDGVDQELRGRFVETARGLRRCQGLETEEQERHTRGMHALANAW
jgi:hypothetical protein